VPVSGLVQPLAEVIAQHIEATSEGCISFATFMDLALYHPEQGYYAAGSQQLGPQGDFITASHLGSDFGELLADQLAEMWSGLGCPDPFDVVEMGAGQGQLTHQVLGRLAAVHSDCFKALSYTLIETSPALQAAQKSALSVWQARGVSISWQALADIPPDCWTGCLFSNELVDALPVHRVTLTEAGLQEQYVTLKSGDRSFEPVLGPLSTLALADYFDKVEIALASPHYPLGYTTEVNLAALNWMAAIAERLKRGYVLTIDYGYTAQQYYNPQRIGGTLQCYNRHRHHSDPFYDVGNQDITAHVDFTTLINQGSSHGLTYLGQVPQALFLMALGLGDRLAALRTITATDGSTLQAAIQHRNYLQSLINPIGLGQFQVLLQGKGLSNAQLSLPLQGFTMPER
jgi:SAM-dependent MidA family methyltransferase